MADDFDPLDVRLPATPGFPRTVMAAGIIWITVGCLILLNMLMLLLLTFGPAAEGWREADAARSALMGLLLGLFGAAFIHVGVQSVRGTAHDTLGNGIGSIIFGLLQGGYASTLILGGLALGAALGGAALIIVFLAGISMLASTALLAAGVLALIGRQEYKDWRKWQKRLDKAAQGRDD